MMVLSDAEAQTLLSEARHIAERAYAPYSHFPVGAALLSDSGEIIGGVNVENASYGLTICAERVAIGNAISQGKRHFNAMAIWASQHPNGSVTPCGACRQVMAEFMPLDAPIITSNPHSEKPPVIITLDVLLPAAFCGIHTLRE